MISRKSIYLTLILLLLVGLGSAAPDEPHRMFGEVTDGEGDILETEVVIQHEGDEITSFETDSDGSYDIMIPNGDYENEELDILIEGETVDTIVFEPLGVAEKDLSYQKEEENQEEQTDGDDADGTGGGGGSLPSDFEEENTNTAEEPWTGENESTTSTDSQDDQTEELDETIETESTSRESDNDDNTSESTQEDETEESGNSITGMFSSTTSSVGEFLTNIVKSIVSPIFNLFG